MKNQVLGYGIIITFAIAIVSAFVEFNEGAIVMLGLLMLVFGVWGAIRLINLEQ